MVNWPFLAPSIKLIHIAYSNSNNTLLPSLQVGKASTMDRRSSSSVLRSSPTQPPSPIAQSKMDRLVKKLLKAGSDGDLGMVKYLLHWNNPAKNNSDDVTSPAHVSVTPVACHPLCDCDDCIKKVRIRDY